jgi:hypothetical protein
MNSCLNSRELKLCIAGLCSCFDRQHVVQYCHTTQGEYNMPSECTCLSRSYF